MDAKTKFSLFSAVVYDKMHLQIIGLKVLYSNNERFLDNYMDKEGREQLDKINAIGVENFTEDDLREYTQISSDYYGLSEETREVVSHYMIVAVFSYYEKSLKKIMEMTHKLTEAELRNCFRKASLEKILQDKFSIVYNALDEATGVEELRSLNNDIKHNGTVGSELANANGKWNIGEALPNTYDDFVRLMDSPRAVLVDLVKQLTPWV